MWPAPEAHVRVSAPWSARKTPVRRALIAIAAGLALADAAVVTLALPQVLLQLDTSVEGVAAVIGVYTAVLVVGLPVSAALHNRVTGAAGTLLFAAASIGCATSNSLELLLVMRGLQALGASALLAAAFDAIDGGRSGRRLWLGAAVAGTAAGPALGGALTELFDWRAIFVAQAPIALAAAPALLATPIAAVHEHLPRPPRDWVTSIALGLLSGAMVAVVFLLVLLLISGWSVDPLAAAATVTVLPLAALAGSTVPGAPPARALAGCLLVAGGIGGLAFIPEASALWTIGPQLLAGFGIGLALPAIAGELLPERTRGEAAALLSIRHAGITLALVVLAPLVAAELDDQVQLARERGTAVVLDAKLPPTDKIELAPRLFAEIESDDPRDALRRAVRRERARIVATDQRDLSSRLQRLGHQLGLDSALLDRLGGVAGGLNELLGGEEESPQDTDAALDRLGGDLDDVVLSAVHSAFRPAFALTGAMALLAALLLLVRGPPRSELVLIALALAIALPLGYLLAEQSLETEPVQIADPCQPRPDHESVGGVEGAVEGVVLNGLDRAACRFGSSREELVLALFDDKSRRDYERDHGIDPRRLDAVLKGIVGI
jgi:MFS transporter